MECKQCGKDFTPARSDAAYCSRACRQSAYRHRSSVTVSRHVTPTDGPDAAALAAVIGAAAETAFAAIPKKYHVPLHDLLNAANQHGHQWLMSQAASATEDRRVALDDEWLKIEKAHAELDALARKNRELAYRYEGKELLPHEMARHLKEEDVKIIRGFLHPDKQTDEGMKARATKVFPKWKEIEDALTGWAKQSPIPVLERYGWTKTVAERRAKRTKK